MEENGPIFDKPGLDSTESKTIHEASNDSSTSNDYQNSSLLTRNLMDNYLKKHKLDLKILPNKRMIKLSDLTATFYASSSSLTTDQKTTCEVDISKKIYQSSLNEFTNKRASDESNNLSLDERVSQEIEDFYDEEEDDEPDIDEEEDEEEEDPFRDDDEDDDDDYGGEEENDDYDDEFLDEEAYLGENYRNSQKENEECALNITSESTTNSVQDFKIESNEINDKISKRNRKKREPSLKLKQKLSNEDLEKIVACVKNRQAKVYTADIKKDNYVDKILRVKLLIGNDLEAKVEPYLQLSNGKMEAFLKKSMFSKDLNGLFDTFVSALCIQDSVADENGISKPTLKCLVVDCEFKSFSEAEIVRHIKRHLAQDGYTCAICSHQFASMTNLQRHLRIHNGEIGKEIKCAHCDYKASTITHVKRHMAHKHLERSLPCPHCSFMGATNAELKIHMARKHLELTGKNPLFLPKYLRKDYQCNICKTQYNDFKEYQTHMYEHTSSLNRFQCNVCPYNCKNFSKLKRHMLYHTGARNFECKICGNKFFQMEHLKRHMQSIHNVIAFEGTNTSATIQNSKPKKLAKTPKDLKEKKGSPLVSPSSSMEVKYTDDSLTLVDNENSIPNISSQANSDKNSNQESDCYKITSKCVFKCQKCEFSTNKLFTLNDHVISKHIECVNYTNETNTNTELIDDDRDDEFDDLDDLDENNFEECDLANTNGNNLNFTCAFCNFKASKKTVLKNHLQNNHSSQVTAPILLSNNSVMTNPNTRFQCGSCKSFLDNVNLFIQHMNEKHKIQVYLIESNNELPKNSNNAQSQIQHPSEMNYLNVETHHPVVSKNSSNTSNLLTNPPRVQTSKTSTTASTKNSKTSHYAQNQHQQIRNFINSSSYLSRQLNNSSNQNTSVRINPLLLKRPDTSVQMQQNNLIKKQQRHVKSNNNLITNNNNSHNLYKNPVMFTNQEIDQTQCQNFNFNQEQLESNSFLNSSFILSNNNEFHDIYNQFVQISNETMENINKNIHVIHDNNNNVQLI